MNAYRQKAERAEQWLHTLYTEIENRFLKPDAPRRARRWKLPTLRHHVGSFVEGL